ncbi:MAG: alpha/beta fold hydrolase [Acidobacteriota bacterium]|nr:alpha/beta fold hydrolase [Acidobacteriota bacterium]
MNTEPIRTTNLGALEEVDTPWGRVRRQDVWFYSDGARIAAELFWPADRGADRSIPGLVMCQGFGGLKKMNVDNFAKYFANAGYAALIFDYRGFGESEGERWRLEPNEQVEDIQCAVTFLTTVEGVDAQRIGVYGTSFGGGNVIAAAATDSRIRCVVSSVGFGDGYRWIHSLRRNWEWIEFTRRLEEDRVRRVLTGVSEQIEPEEIMVRDPESIESERNLRSKVPERAFKLRLRDGDFILGFSPEAYASRIAPRPVLLIGVKDDGLISNDETNSLYEHLGEPKKLVWMGPIGHHAVYYGEHLEEVLRNAREWFDEHLK